MDLRCPKCNSTDLKKVSLAHEEGLLRSEGRTRLRAVVAGSGGPDLVVARATTHGTQQSALSKKLAPPVKWSYLKVIGWSVLVFLSAGWLVFYVNSVTTNATNVSSAPLTLFALISGAIFALLLFLVWRHNHSSYQAQYAQWDKSFICERCGTVSGQVLQ
jgi:uncharacterized integral membrane protein